MEINEVTTTLFLDTRTEKANGKYPLKLTIYSNGEKKRYRTKIDLSSEEWEKIKATRLRDENLKNLKIKTMSILSEANKIIEDLEEFSFASFESVFFRQSRKKTDLSLKTWFDGYIQELDDDDRVGTRISYQTTYNSLNQFRRNLKLTDITKEFLERYESSMRSSGKSPSTIGIYLRQLRAIINIAIREGILKQENYPFRRYEIPTSRNVKKALDDEELKLLLEYQPITKKAQMRFDFWVLSYLCNGMNMTDILHLEPGNFDGSFLYYHRRKTIRTRKKDLRPIKVALNARAIFIINKWRNKDAKLKYLFPVLEEGLSAKTTKYRVQRFIKVVNKQMLSVHDDLHLKQQVTTYAARHSFATRLMRNGASALLIKECLGHRSVSVTENYLGDFDDAVKHDFAKMLTFE